MTTSSDQTRPSDRGAQLAHVTAIERTTGDRHVVWEIDCPYCGRVHTHGAGRGHRAAHCAQGRRHGGYILDPPAGWEQVDR